MAVEAGVRARGVKETTFGSGNRWWFDDFQRIAWDAPVWSFGEQSWQAFAVAIF